MNAHTHVYMFSNGPMCGGGGCVSPLKDVSEGYESEGQRHSADQIPGLREDALVLGLQVPPVYVGREPEVFPPQPLVQHGLHPAKRERKRRGEDRGERDAGP